MDEKRAVTLDEGQGLADEFGIEFFETSAKSGDNVENAFFTLAKDIRARQTAAPQGAPPGLKISGNAATIEKKKSCC
jgi:Ras-related protein Rab-8A